MPRKSASLDLPLAPRRAGVPAYLWLYEVLRGDILSGRLAPGTRLPATRELARQYQLARGTVVLAFDQLKGEGYVQALSGSGTYVNHTLPEQLLHAHRGPSQGHPMSPISKSVQHRPPRIGGLPGDDAPSTRAFRANQPALDLFPTTLWAQVAGRRLRRASTRDLYTCGAMGYTPLRAAVAQYLSTARGVRCSPEQVAIVGGVQEALSLTARLLLKQGDRVCMENPGYPEAARVFENSGARLTPVPVDAEGMCVPSGRLRSVRLAYTTPAHQFPLGMSMSLPRRMLLLEWARRVGAMIFEDDYDSEYRYSGRPLSALQGLDHHGVVLFAGSFSKVLFPSLRLGYLVLPPAIVDRFAELKSISSRHAPLLDQAILHDFMEAGHFARHVRRMREVYAERLHALLEHAERLQGLMTVSPVEAGLQTVGLLAKGLDAKKVACAARARRVEVAALNRNYRGAGAPQALHLGFAAVAPKEIKRGLADLESALRSCVKR